MSFKNKMIEKTNRRSLGVHITSIDIFQDYIFPEIKDKLKDYIWVDLFAGEGNLILPILKTISPEERVEFFKNHIYLFDIQPDMVQKCLKNAEVYNIPQEIAKKNITQRDNLANFPIFLKKKNYPIFHITNPPYLYLGYIRKHDETTMHLKYFEKENDGYQDLYQIAMMNDLKNGIEDLIYIIPSNFLFGAAVSNKFRIDFLKYYNILKMFIFETKIFEFTGTNTCIGFFKRKNQVRSEPIEFVGIKIRKSGNFLNIKYNLKPEFKYRGGSEFDDFVEQHRSINPLNVKYYLLNKEVENNKGFNKVRVIDSSNYISNAYLKIVLQVNDSLKEKITSNILYVRTVDTGSTEGRVGLYEIKKDFEVESIYVSKNTYRTSPIHLFFEPKITIEDQFLLKFYFNFFLEHFRTKLDSEFLTTYKYSNAEYTRKYLGLTQVRKLIQTCPIFNLDKELKEFLKNLIIKEDVEKILEILRKYSQTMPYKRKLS